MEDCMIEEPCRACDRVICNCPPEPEDDEFVGGTAECLDSCFSAHEHVLGCPHGPECEITYDWVVWPEPATAAEWRAAA